MTKFIATATKTKVIFRKVTSTKRPIAIIYDRLYRIDDKIAVASAEDGDSIVMYDLEGQQPYGSGEYLDPEFTKVMIDSLKLGKGKIEKTYDWNFEKIAGIAVAGLAIWAVASQMLGGS